MLVAFGMIGTSLSGVTFISVPGGVGSGNFYYFQIVIGYLLGYLVIAFVLLPLYYRLQVTSIYSYLNQRFGGEAHKAGAWFFIVSRTIGATARLYLVISVLQTFIFNSLGISFEITALVILVLILLYTFEGGVKTIIYTDTLQTTGMLSGLVVCILVISNALGTNLSGAWDMMSEKGYTSIFNLNILSGSFALKHIFGGMFIAIAMTGLDQEMMQKNISVKNLKDSQKNMLTFSAVLAIVNFLFLVLGGVLYLYASKNGIATAPDDLFPTIALGNTFSGIIGIVFIVAIISALFPSVDGAITSLTSCFCVDILNITHSNEGNESAQKQKRLRVHFSFALLFFLLVLAFKWMNDKLIVDFILKFAGITYGPLLGLFAFGIISNKKIKSKFLWIICLFAPLISLALDIMSNPSWYEAKLHFKTGLNAVSESVFYGYKIGNELILINGILMYFGLWLISKSQNEKPATT